MTPKEKAEFLFQKYLPYTYNETTEKIKKDTKQCCLIAVNELIEQMEIEKIRQLYWYWKKVEKEIELI